MWSLYLNRIEFKDKGERDAEQRRIFGASGSGDSAGEDEEQTVSDLREVTEDRGGDLQQRPLCSNETRRSRHTGDAGRGIGAARTPFKGLGNRGSIL